MKFCSNCGKQLDDTATVCDACGTPTTQLPVPAPSSAPSPVKENPALGIVALILSIIGFLTGILTIGTYLDLLVQFCAPSSSCGSLRKNRSKPT
ncbi:MAG: zinc-ribbon domain-containing protein [Evtepia sp.]